MARSHKSVGSMYLQRRDDGVHYSGSQVVIPLLLILAGDIEINPGPGKHS